MQKYLDEYGVAHLWSNAKNYIDEKYSGSTGSSTFLVKAPVGTIVIWSGTSDNIPVGWQLCDGTNGTPDLRDKFVLGAGTAHLVGDSGGSEEVTLTPGQLPTHKHAIATSGYAEKPDSWGTVWSVNSYINSSASINTSTQVKYCLNTTSSKASLESSPKGEAHPNMPPYYTLCYIIKLTADKTDPSNIYSEEETVIGQYFGKPLYRRSFNVSAYFGEFNLSASVRSKNINVDITNIPVSQIYNDVNTVTRLYIKQTSFITPIVIPSENFIKQINILHPEAYKIVVNQKVYLYPGISENINVSASNFSGVCVVEYTKTTD